jgi:hypothetical protein
MMKETVGLFKLIARDLKNHILKNIRKRNSKSHEKNKLVESMNNKDNVIGL